MKENDQEKKSSKVTTFLKMSELHENKEDSDSSNSTDSGETFLMCNHTPCSLIKYSQVVEIVFGRVFSEFMENTSLSFEYLLKKARIEYKQAMYPMSFDYGAEIDIPECVNSKLVFGIKEFKKDGLRVWKEYLEDTDENDNNKTSNISYKL